MFYCYWDKYVRRRKKSRRLITCSAKLVKLLSLVRFMTAREHICNSSLPPLPLILISLQNEHVSSTYLQVHPRLMKPSIMQPSFLVELASVTRFNNHFTSLHFCFLFKVVTKFPDLMLGFLFYSSVAVTRFYSTQPTGRNGPADHMTHDAKQVLSQIKT